jgi:hypothetical protein
VVELVKINRHGEHQQAGRDEIFAAPRAASESATGDGSGAFDADVIAALRHLAEAIHGWSSGRFAVSSARRGVLKPGPDLSWTCLSVALAADMCLAPGESRCLASRSGPVRKGMAFRRIQLFHAIS